MNKKLVALVSLLLAFAMLFALSSCSLTQKEETTKKLPIPVRTPGLPTEQLYTVADNGVTYYLNAEGTTLDETTSLDDAGMQAKNVSLFNYFSINLGTLTNGDTIAIVAREDKQSIGKQTNENGDSVKYCEENSKVNAAVDGLRKMMLEDTVGYKDTGFTNDFAAYLHSVDYLSKLTVADVERSTCVENMDSGERTITITFKSPVTKELIDQNFGFDETNTAKKTDSIGMDKVYEEFAKAADYMTIDKAKTSLTYVDCTVTLVTDIPTDKVKTIQYATGINVNTEVTGQGTLADVGTVPVKLLYSYNVNYTINREDPEAVPAE